MSVLEGPRREVRHVVKDGSAYWVEFKDGRIVFGDGRTCARTRSCICRPAIRPRSSAFT